MNTLKIIETGNGLNGRLLHKLNALTDNAQLFNDERKEAIYSKIQISLGQSNEQFKNPIQTQQESN